MENIHVTQVALMFLENAKKRVQEHTQANPSKPFSKSSGGEIIGHISYAYEFIEKVLKNGIKMA